MKTISQIHRKIKQLKNKLSKKTIKENFGDKEQRELDEFIGDKYEYDYGTRLVINDVVNLFSNWCGDYTG